MRGETVNPIRMKTLFRAYEMKYPQIVRFYGNEDGSFLVCAQGNIATVYTESETILQEAAPFLQMQFSEILTEYPVKLIGYQLEAGMMYQKAKEDFSLCQIESISHNIQESYEILSQVFSSINADTYMQWYADTSHRIRHGVSKIYTCENQCTATAYGVIDGVMLITQLATLPKARGKGLASQMLAHCMTDCQARKMILHSEGRNSDLFYEHNGFSSIGKWYYYVSDQSHWIV